MQEELDANRMKRIQASFLAFKHLQLEPLDVNKYIDATNNLLALEKSMLTQKGFTYYYQLYQKPTYLLVFRSLYYFYGIYSSKFN